MSLDWKNHSVLEGKESPPCPDHSLASPCMSLFRNNHSVLTAKESPPPRNDSLADPCTSFPWKNHSVLRSKETPPEPRPFVGWPLQVFSPMRRFVGWVLHVFSQCQPFSFFTGKASPESAEFVGRALHVFFRLQPFCFPAGGDSFLFQTLFRRSFRGDVRRKLRYFPARGGSGVLDAPAPSRYARPVNQPTKSPCDVLLAFITAMHEWEKEAWQESRRTRSDANPSAYQVGVEQRMNAIFAAYCTPKKRPYGRQGSFQHPPEYDPATEKILEVVEASPQRVVIHTQQESGFRNRCQYVLLHQRGQWLIDSRRIAYDDGTSIPNTL